MSKAVGDSNWRSHPLSVFQDKFHGNQKNDKQLPHSVRKFYKRQDQLISDLEAAVNFLSTDEVIDENRHLEIKKQRHRVGILIKMSFVFNFALVAGKLCASILSGSLSVISSLMDSVVDLVSGLTLWFTAKQMKKSSPYTYPQGQRRLEPISVIILAVIMASASVQIIVEASQTLYNMIARNQGPPHMSNLSIGLVASTIVVKLFLFIICWKFGSGESVDALKNDHKNDCLSNAVALIFSTLSSRIEEAPHLKYLDPIGAILIGMYIIYSWWIMGAEHTRNLSGYSANPAYMQKISFICINHHEAIERLDTVRVFHFGSNYLVEVDIVLPRNMDLHKAHDIGESLQKKLESLEDVERAFVHLDYEFTHHPSSEHKPA